MRIVVAGGGTAGHIFPALAIIKLLNKDDKVLYIGTEHGMEAKLVRDDGIDFASIVAKGILGKGVFTKVQGSLVAAQGVTQALFHLRRFRPDVVLGTGGYVSGPVVLAAKMLGIKTAIQEQNAFPGFTNRTLSHIVDGIFLPFSEAAKFFPKTVADKIVVTGNPLRPEIMQITRDEALQQLNLKETDKVVVVMGGSLGSEAINTAIAGFVATYEGPKIVLLWATGERYYDRFANTKGSAFVDVRASAFLPSLFCYAVADVVIARSGAMTITELTAKGLPAILVPSPNVAQNHQEVNARLLSDRGAAVLLLEKDLDSKVLVQHISGLLNTPTEREKMAVAALILGKPQAAEHILHQLRTLIGH